MKEISDTSIPLILSCTFDFDLEDIPFYLGIPFKIKSGQINPIFKLHLKIPCKSTRWWSKIKKVLLLTWFWKHSGNSPTCGKYQTHVNIVLHQGCVFGGFSNEMSRKVKYRSYTGVPMPKYWLNTDRATPYIKNTDEVLLEQNPNFDQIIWPPSEIKPPVCN